MQLHEVILLQMYKMKIEKIPRETEKKELKCSFRKNFTQLLASLPLRELQSTF